FDSMGKLTEEKEAFEFALGITYGIKFSRKIEGGFVFNYLRSDLVAFISNSWAFDVGVRWQNLLTSSTITIPSKEMESLSTFKPMETPSGIGIGIALLNAGPHIAYLDPSQADPIPQRLRIGFSHHTFSSPIFGMTLLFDFEKELVHREGPYADSFVKAWFTSWKNQPFRNATYHFGFNLNLVYIFSLRFGYQYQPFEDFFNTGIFTIGFGLDLKYLSIQFGTWLERDNISALYKDSNLWGIRVGNIHLR
ncbi:MAG: hypothetical protein ACE5GL_10440, partial [Calditrichia bacterium]